MEQYDRFKKVVNGIEVYYAWVEIPEALLSSIIPREGLVYLHGEDEEGNIRRTVKGKQVDIDNVTLPDFTLHSAPSKNIGKVIITIGACLGDRYRIKPVNESDMNMWNNGLLPHGFGVNKWLDELQMKALLPEEPQ